MNYNHNVLSFPLSEFTEASMEPTGKLQHGRDRAPGPHGSGATQGGRTAAPSAPTKASPAGLADTEAIPTTPARRTGQRSKNTLRCRTERFSPWPDITEEGLHFTARQENTFLGPIKTVREMPNTGYLVRGAV